MADNKFVYNARFVGRRAVDGPLNDFRLSEVVAAFQTEGNNKKTVQDEIRCNVEFSDKNLLITFIKKDEGFESDTESSKSVEPGGEAGAADKSVSAVDEKIIKDHVFRFSESGGEDSYSSNSGGSDSETSDHNKSNSAASSTSTSPTAELSKYKFDHLDSYSITDVLICHTDKVYSNCVIWVIRRAGALEALVFECTTEENARQLYRKFHEVSKRTKLERHRRRKSDGGSIVTRASLPDRAPPNPPLPALPALPALTINNVDTTDIERAVEAGQQKWSLVQHTDKNGVTHIEVESAEPGQQPGPANLVKPAGRESEPRSLVSFSPSPAAGKFAARGLGRTGKAGSNFAKELESILSTEMKRREEGGWGGARAGERGEAEASSPRPATARQRPPGESLSLRQRAPAMLLRKLDEFEEKAHKIWAKAEAEEENRKIWNKTSNSVIGISSPPPKGPQLDPIPAGKEKGNQKGKVERDENMKNSEREKVPVNGVKSRHKEAAGNKKDDGNNRILIPTKTGKEPPRKLYPKESPPLQYGSRFLPLGVSQMAAQPHSLPIYPAGLAWTGPRYPGELPGPLDWRPGPPDPAQLWRHPGQHPADLQGRSRSRDRSRADLERRRAQSKSPARRPGPHRHPDSAPSDLSGFSRMVRGLGGAVAGVRARIAKKGGEGKAGQAGCSMSDMPDAAHLKSNLKKQKNNNIHPDQAEQPNQTEKVTNNNNSDNKKVHFNKFATVQMMG